MHPVKGFHILSTALDASKFKNWKLSVFTMPSGGEMDYYETHKNWASIHQNVSWHENIIKDELIDEIDKLDIIIVPSLTEMAPLIVREAFARRKPVITSDIPSLKDLVRENKNGSQFNRDDPESLRNQIEKILSRKVDLLSLNEFPAYRTFSDIGEEMELAYRDIMN